MENISYFSDRDILSLCPFPELISELEARFMEDYKSPERLHYKYGSNHSHLIMPSFGDGKHGVKLVNIHHDNRSIGLATIQSLYILFDSENGIPKAMMDGKALTNMRTAAISALASKYLSRVTAKSLLMIGTGSLAPFMVRAYQATRNLEAIFLWGRDYNKSIKMAAKLNSEFDISVVAVRDKNLVQEGVDIISCATSAKQALVLGDDIQAGQHIDLVGSYTKGMEECDTAALLKSKVIVDAKEDALLESGEIIKALEEGYSTEELISGDLMELLSDKVKGRKSEEEITLFKSVGLAKEDLIAAAFILRESAKRA